MTFRQIIFNNILRNSRIYMAHFLSGAFAVLVFFIFAMLLYHPQLQGELASTSETISLLSTMGLRISQYSLFVCALLFLLYSFSSYLKSRKREFGILLIHGMSLRQQNKLILAETMLIGTASIVTGILTGLIFMKLLLLIVADLLGITSGLPFYFPIDAIWTTAITFLLMFLLVSFFATGIVKKVSLIDLFQSDEKPRPEPQASVELSILAFVLIGVGYGSVFSFVRDRSFSYLPLVLGVVFTVAGTYFLFTQFNVYFIQLLKKNERTFFRKTNLISISEMAFRIRDNAVMFFMVTVVSAVAFTGMGICIALGAPGLSETVNPFAFTYDSYEGNTKEKEQEHVTTIENKLKESGFSYQLIEFTPKLYSQGVLISLSDYNKLAAALGYPTETLQQNNDVIWVPSSVQEINDAIRSAGEAVANIGMVSGDKTVELNLIKRVPYIVTPYSARGNILVVSDAIYKQSSSVEYGTSSRPTFTFHVKNWMGTKALSNELFDQFNRDEEGQGRDYFFDKPIILQWLEGKQRNGILFILSFLIGVVFFTFAASVIYLRLYTDLERDQKQYQMIAKVGLSRRELKTIVTHQFRFMFYIPFFIAVLHSTVAFIAFQQLIYFSFYKEAATIFASFFIVQVIYFYVARWRYLNHIFHKLI